MANVSFSETKAALLPWLARSTALNRDQVGLIATAEGLGASPAMVEEIKAAIAGGSTGTLPELAGDGAAVTAFAAQTSATSAFFAAHSQDWFQRMPFNTRLNVLASDISASSVGEGQAIPMALPDLDGFQLRQEKAAVIVAMSEEILRNVTRAGQAFFNTQLRRAVGRVADTRLFAALLTTGTPDLSADVADAAAVRAALRACLSYVRTNAEARLFWTMTPGALNLLCGVEDRDPRLDVTGGSLMGIPITLTDALGANQVALIDGLGVGAEIDRITITSSREAALEFSDTPTGDASDGTGAQMINLWQAHMGASRIVLYYGIEPLRNNCIARLTLAEGSP